MDILLIDPPYTSLKGLPTDVGYNIGMTSLAAYLRREGLETAVIMGDLLADLPSNNVWFSENLKKYAAGQHAYEKAVDDKTHYVWQKLIDMVSKANPAAVGISYLTPLKNVVERIASLIREINPDIKIITGSFHPTTCPEEVMRNPDIDFVVTGEGEVPLLSLVQEVKKEVPRWETVPGIYYRDGDGRVRSNPGVNLIENLDELPFLARDLVLNCDYGRYRGHSIYTARGCPYVCSFCADNRLWGGRVRRRSVESVLEEIILLIDNYQVDFLNIVDGTFTYDRKYLQRFCNELIDRRLGIKWGCTARYDNLDEDLLKLMKRANCAGLYFGLESGSDRVLKAVQKKITVETIIRVTEMVSDSGIPSVTSVLIGLPGEGKEDIEDTLRLMRKVKTDSFDVNTYVPLPGTPLYGEMSEAEAADVDWRKVSFKSLDSFFSKSISREDFAKYRTEAYKIADGVRRKTLLRFGARSLLQAGARIFKKSDR